MTASVITAVILTVLAAAGTYLGASMHRHLPLTGWLDRMPAPYWPRLRQHTDPGPPRPPSGAVPHQIPGRAGTRVMATQGEAPDRRWSGRPVNGPQTLTGRALARLIPARGCHAATPDPFGLTFDENRGQWRHTETGPITIPPGYGTIRPGTKYEAAERAVRNAWGWP